MFLFACDSMLAWSSKMWSITLHNSLMVEGALGAGTLHRLCNGPLVGGAHDGFVDETQRENVITSGTVDNDHTFTWTTSSFQFLSVRELLAQRLGRSWQCPSFRQPGSQALVKRSQWPAPFVFSLAISLRMGKRRWSEMDFCDCWRYSWRMADATAASTFSGMRTLSLSLALPFLLSGRSCCVRAGAVGRAGSTVGIGSSRVGVHSRGRERRRCLCGVCRLTLPAAPRQMRW